MKNNKRYIGQHRYVDEKDPMCYYNGSGILIKKAIKKYGIENFKKEVLYMRIKTQETANAVEIWAIEKYKPEYNIAKGGYGGNTGLNPMLGKHCSDSTKKKISEANKGKKRSLETKRKISEAKKGNKNFLGKQHTDEYKRKMSERMKGRIVSEETRRKLSESHKGSKNPMWKKNRGE